MKLALVLLALTLAGCQTVDDVSVKQMSTVELRKHLEEMPQPEETRPIPTCAPAEQMTAILVNSFKEIPTKAGLASDGSLMILFIAEDTTWTLIRVVNGLSCVMAFGNNMQDVQRDKSI